MTKEINIMVMDGNRNGTARFPGDMSNQDIIEAICDKEASLDSIDPFRPDSERIDIDYLAYDLCVDYLGYTEVSSNYDT